MFCEDIMCYIIQWPILRFVKMCATLFVKHKYCFIWEYETKKIEIDRTI